MFWITITVILLIAAMGTWRIRLHTTDYGKTVFGPSKSGLPLITIGCLVFWLLITAVASTNTVNAGYIGLVRTFGSYTGQQGPGLNTKAPWQSVDHVNGRVQKATINMSGGKAGSAVSKETQPVYAELTVNYQVELSKARELYTNVGADYYRSIVDPRVQQAFKAITVEYTTAEIAPNREKIRDRAKSVLIKQLEPYGITVNDLLVKNLDFSPAFLTAIEAKQVAGQEALAAQARVATSKAVADSAVETARGQAEAARINGRALQANPLYLQQLAIEKLNPNVQVIMLPANGQNMILPSSVFGAGK